MTGIASASSFTSNASLESPNRELRMLARNVAPSLRTRNIKSPPPNPQQTIYHNSHCTPTMDGSSASPRLMSSSLNAQTLQKDSQPDLQRKRRPKMTVDEKVDKVFHLLRNELHWSLIDFFRALYSNPQHYRRRLAFEEAAYRTPDLLECVLAPSPTSHNTRLALLDALSWGSAELRTEVLELGQTSLFGKYSSESSWAEINEESLSNLMQA